MSDSDVNQILKELNSLRKDFRAHKKEMEPVKDWFEGMNWAKSALMWTLGLVGAVIGIIIGIKQI